MDRYGNWRIVGEFVEVESGRRSDRPKLDEALAAARVRQVPLVVAKVDRPTRSVAFLSRLLEAGVDVRFADLPAIEGATVRKRPRTPAKGRGSVQRAIKRAFAATSASALTSTQIYDWAHVRRRLGRRKSMPFGVYSRTLRTLRAMCDPVGRGSGSARPILWRLRNSKAD